MNKNVRDKWIAKLLSGQYKRGTHALHKVSPKAGNETYCCLGVLCELYNEEHPENPLNTFNNEGEVGYGTVKSWGEDYTYVYPPRVVADWAGLDYFQQRQLARLNDGAFDRKRGLSFREMARYIRNNH